MHTYAARFEWNFTYMDLTFQWKEFRQTSNTSAVFPSYAQHHLWSYAPTWLPCDPGCHCLGFPSLLSFSHVVCSLLKVLSTLCKMQVFNKCLWRCTRHGGSAVTVFPKLTKPQSSHLGSRYHTNHSTDVHNSKCCKWVAEASTVHVTWAPDLERPPWGCDI